MSIKIITTLTCLVLALLFPNAVFAADINGVRLSILWGIPFMGLLLSIAAGPLLIAHFWHRHFGKIVAAWVLAFLLPFATVFGAHVAAAVTVHALLAEYFPFVILLIALFVVAGGIFVRGDVHGTPALNTGLLALGTVLASFMGTTGASMLLIRPLIRANGKRKYAVHIVVFFIFLVANVGGALTPLGDPPLFLGFLKGVNFFWTMQNIFFETLFLSISLLTIFYFLDSYYYKNQEDELPPKLDLTSSVISVRRIRFEGKINFVLLLVVIALVLMSGFWRPGVTFSVMGTPIALQNLLRDVALIVVVLLSLWLTPQAARAGNEFSWRPMLEVAQVFAGIFVTIIPVIMMLRDGQAGAFSAVVRTVTGIDGQPIDAMYFWITGLLSSFLDNAPTYLVFFNSASGDAQTLMTTFASTLAAISAGAVFMGANSYIGNAPNMMVKAIAEDSGIKMPSFFAYMAWSMSILLPLFMVMTFLFF